jgi:hypothetical protein
MRLLGPDPVGTLQGSLRRDGGVGIFGRRKELDPSPWVLQGWDRPDQAQIRQFTRANSHAWDYYVPNLRQVDCKGENKTAIFLKVGFDYPTWSESVEPVGHAWRWFPLEGYVVLQLSMYFLDPQRRSIGLHAPGQVTVMTRDLVEKVGHKMVCRTLFDPGDRRHAALVTAWAAQPGQSLIAFMSEQFDTMNYVTMELTREARALAVAQLREARGELAKPDASRGSFTAACAAARTALPAVGRWETLEGG